MRRAPSRPRAGTHGGNARDYARDNSSYLLGVIGGLAIGALAMYLFDPEQGRRRRALMTDQFYSLLGQTWKTVDTTTRDWSSRARSATAGVKEPASQAASPVISEAAGPSDTLH